MRDSAEPSEKVSIARETPVVLVTLVTVLAAARRFHLK
jgi:hypothetical protein